LSRPELLILDEPTTGLDPAVRLALWQRVRELRAAGTSILLTTHYMDEAERLCDRLAIMADGRLRAEGEPARLIRETLARETLEIDLPAAEEASLQGELARLPRLRSGRRLALYVDDAAALLETLRHRRPEAPGVQHGAVVRPTNLEDVFLRLTGDRLESGEADGARGPA
jgi:lipooligosaccharide transport system ATP-binding protein